MVQDLSNSPFCWHNFNKRFYVKCGLENMTPSFREQVKKIVGKVYMHGGTAGSRYGNGKGFENVSVAVAEILSLVRECVPDKRHLDYGGGGDIVWASAESEKNGWNACRQAILNEIGEDNAETQTK